jgi:hypothetical protein
MQSQMIHHSALSFRKLRAMKIKDRSSFHVIILDESLATPESLSSQQMFGQFGTISSIRILKDTSPREAHIRFNGETAASAAITWCNSQSPLFVNAKYGYQKYCVKFINNQPCDIPGCAMRHAWSDTRDILNFRSLTPAGIDPLSPTASPDAEMFMKEKQAMMQRIAMLQKQCVEQQKVVQVVNQRMEMARRQNSVLKMEANKMVKMGIPLPPMDMNNQAMMNQMAMKRRQYQQQQMQMMQQRRMMNGMRMHQNVGWQQQQQQQPQPQQQYGHFAMQQQAQNIRGQQMPPQRHCKQFAAPTPLTLTAMNTVKTNSPCSSNHGSSEGNSPVSPTSVNDSTSESWEESVNIIVDEVIKANGGLSGGLSGATPVPL